MEVVGREKAKEKLDNTLKSDRPELLAVIGRRRIGKTYLIKKYLEKDIIFKFSGLHNGTQSEHLERFAKEVNGTINQGISFHQPKSWFEAFDLLRLVIDSKKTKKKKVVFLD